MVAQVLGTSQGRWTARLIPSLEEWLKCSHGAVDYLTQFLTGHDQCDEHLHEMRHKKSLCSVYCMTHIDNTKHTFFECKRWSAERQRAWKTFRQTSSPDTVVGAIIKSEETWSAMMSYTKAVITTKKIEEGYQ